MFDFSGIEYVEEFQKENSNVEPRYVCVLCEGKCDPRTLFPHLTGSKHRINYIVSVLFSATLLAY